ncbi:MAG: hypothetical protein QGH93_04690 [Gammaproteobacteria bacterium]|nr:hypothetical protein [Chromatiales bacterium]MDP6674133.1 hypothetical protein [Gammaproteobacteria bacterium]
MNKTEFLYPRNSYPDLFTDFYADINGGAAAETPCETQADNWWCRSQTSRGAVLDKAGYAMLHIVDGKIYNSPGSIKLFETLAYPVNPRVPGLIFLMNLNQTEAAGKSVVFCIDIFFQNNKLNSAATEILTTALKPVYERHDQDFSERYKAEPGRILAGLVSECGVMDFFTATDSDSFPDELLHAGLSAYRDILTLTNDDVPTDEDHVAMNQHRQRLLEWLTVDDIGIQFATASGVPMSVIEAYGYPPVVRY